METKSDTSPLNALFNPLAGLEAAAQWNAAAYEWMTQGWQQWWSLMAAPLNLVPSNFASPSYFVTPAQAGAQGIETRSARASVEALDSRLRGNDGRTRDDKPAARAKVPDNAKSKRGARPKKAGAKGRARS
ncbi:MAG TPA: hypothetical protein VF522_21805 [Ramlibacter sp.]|uniref:hypothetical protein n=1 Tax=Ramlibacter sp. TaxID=1917967 RepID=UPI002ED1B0DD